MEKILGAIWIILFLIFSDISSASEFATLRDNTTFDCSDLRIVACKGLLPVNTSPDNKVSLLPNGYDSFNKRLASLKSAKKSIRIQALIFKNDTSGRMFGEILKEKARQGLDVSIIVDGLSNFLGTERDLYKELKEAGVEVLGFDTRVMVILAEGFLGSNPGWINNRYHEKIWIVDGEEVDGIAIMGGYNIADEYFRIATETKLLWTDMDLLMKGSIVKDAMKIYDRNRNYFRYIQHTSENWYGGDIWHVESAHANLFEVYDEDLTGADYVRVNQSNDLQQGASTSVAQATVTPNQGDNNKWQLEQIAVEFANRDIQLREYSPTKMRLFQSRPRLRETYIEQAYVKMINDAKSEVLITNAYFIPSEELITAMRNAAKRGVKIYIVTNSIESNDSGKAINVVARHMFHSILAVNVDPMVIHSGGFIQIYEWVGPAVREGTLHAKWMVVDRKASLIGSYNLDPRSHRINSESAVTLESREVGIELARYFHLHEIKGLVRVTEVTPEIAEGWFYLNTLESIKQMFVNIIKPQL